MSTIPAFLSFWGKARAEVPDGPRAHPVAHHLVDVALTLDALLEVRPQVTGRVARLLGLDAVDARRLLVALAALHDLGKFAPSFQAKAEDQWPQMVLGARDSFRGGTRPHTEDGLTLWQDELAASVGERLWRGGEAALDALMPAVFGHHGTPVAAGTERAAMRFRGGLEPARRCADTVVALLLPAPIDAPVPRDASVRLATWLLSGLLTVSDWVGSNQRWFRYTAPDPMDETLESYAALARDRAVQAIREAGLRLAAASPVRTFAAMFPDKPGPTPMQEWAAGVPLPEEPTLFLIEDVTGAGKTEAAHLLVHRLLAAGRAAGAFWAMPTMATANAMYDRQGALIDGLYERRPGTLPPSLVLAHGQQRLHDGFRATVFDGVGAPEVEGDEADAEIDGAAACAAFLADDRRAALLADVGAGTIDQALLAVLPSRFATVRLAGLAEKVLVIDEAHAYDPYMRTELAEMLRFQAALGGCAVVLSATLPQRRHEELVRAWTEGAAGGRRRLGAAVTSATAPTSPVSPCDRSYPLATVVGGGTPPIETPVSAAAWSHRDVSVRLVHEVDLAIEHVIHAAECGGAVAWVRNTVRDCLEAAEALRQRGVEPIVFHARFAQGDRQMREREVMEAFGPAAAGAARRARVVIATQVIEQSLDLDFDAMVSDLAPIDLLVQRAGRLWRHERRTAEGRPAALSREVVVLSPPPDVEPPTGWLGGAFAGTAHVYGDVGVLWRTVRTLAARSRIVTPGGLRALVEQVYGPDAEELPDSLQAAAGRSHGLQGAQAAAGNFAVLKVTDGYDAGAMGWTTDVRAVTRLDADRVTLRLARREGGGTLRPLIHADGPPWRSWALSEVGVSMKRVPRGTREEPQDAAAVARLRAEWGRFEQEIPVLVLEEIDPATGTLGGRLIRPDGRTVECRYSSERGLDIGVSDR